MSIVTARENLRWGFGSVMSVASRWQLGLSGVLSALQGVDGQVRTPRWQC